jgi:hypothetical protein
MSNGADYQIDYYTYPNGNYLFTQNASVGSNEKFIMEFPELNQERALVWFVAHRTFNKNLVLDTNSTELVIEKTKMIFPNPSFDQIYVSNEIGEFIVKDINGKIQVQNKVRTDGDYIILDVSNYPSGVYLLFSFKNYPPLKFVKL